MVKNASAKFLATRVHVGTVGINKGEKGSFGYLEHLQRLEGTLVTIKSSHSIRFLSSLSTFYSEIQIYDRE